MKYPAFALLAGLAIATAGPLNAQVALRFSGFGDFTGGIVAGDYASSTARTSFESFGADPDPVNTSRGFGLTGTDFVVIADMTDRFAFLGEINLQAGRGGSGEIELDIERFFMDYQVNEAFNLQGGLFFTPIGYNNRFLYARAWLMHSIQVPDFYEEELNLVPTHTIGVAAYGAFSLGPNARLNYIVSAGNGRASAPDGAVYARDPSSSKEFTALVEVVIPGYKDSRIGISGWTGGIETSQVDNPGDVVPLATAPKLALWENGLDAFVVINTRAFTFNTEGVASQQTDRLGTLPQKTYSVWGGMAELALHTMQGRLHPFIRYDQTSVPNGGGPYLGLREGDGEMGRIYVPEFKAIMTGLAYDVNLHLRVKAEYQRHFDGPRRKNAFAVQAAFGF